MPGARAEEFRRAAIRPGFERTRQTGNHELWIHPDWARRNDRRSMADSGKGIGPPLFNKVLAHLGIKSGRIPQDEVKLRRDFG